MTPAGTAVREAFAAQAEACAGRGSPFAGLLCDVLGRSLDRSTEVGRRVLDWPGRVDVRGDSVPLRLAAGLHDLVRCGRPQRLAGLRPPKPRPRREALEGVVDLVKEWRPAWHRKWNFAVRGRGEGEGGAPHEFFPGGSVRERSRGVVPTGSGGVRDLGTLLMANRVPVLVLVVKESG